MTYTQLMIESHGFVAACAGWAAWGLRGAFDRWAARRALRNAALVRHQQRIRPLSEDQLEDLRARTWAARRTA